jgi:hypothetical protein
MDHNNSDNNLFGVRFYLVTSANIHTLRIRFVGRKVTSSNLYAESVETVIIAP